MSNDDFKKIGLILADPAFAERVKALQQPPSTKRWISRKTPIVHQGVIEGEKRFPLCGSTVEPVYLTDHKFLLGPNGPVTCAACREKLGL